MRRNWSSASWEIPPKEPDATLGFTLLEVSVVLAILCVLAGLTACAVQLAREASRRAECLDHQRQIVLGFHNRDAAVGSIYNRPFRMNRPCNGERLGSAFAGALPYLGYQAAFDEIPACREFLRDYRESDASWEGENSIPLFLCPSDGGPGKLSYRTCHGDTRHAGWDELGPARQPSGVFPFWGVVRLSDIRDGLSQTVGISEKIRSDPDERFQVSADTWQVVGYSATSDADLVELSTRTPVQPVHWKEVGGQSWTAVTPYQSAYGHLVPPNWPGGDLYPDDVTVVLLAARSYHPGGVVVGRMDGTSQFVSETIDVKLWKALATRGGEEAANSF